MIDTRKIFGFRGNSVARTRAHLASARAISLPGALYLENGTWVGLGEPVPGKPGVHWVIGPSGKIWQLDIRGLVIHQPATRVRMEA